jgi:hypothetical protein
VRSPTGSTGTPGPLSQQPSSQQSTDDRSEAGRSNMSLSFKVCLQSLVQYSWHGNQILYYWKRALVILAGAEFLFTVGFLSVKHVRLREDCD